MKFTKMHGCGNDYIYVDVTKEPIHDPVDFSIKYSDRHFGIGGDGLVTIGLSDNADFFMHIYNADGSEAQMCGNATRCVAKYVYERGLTDKTQISLETLSGIKYLDLTVEDGIVTGVRVDMGTPSLKAESIPVAGLGDEVINVPVTVAGRDWLMTCVSVGNPHAIVWCDDVDEFDITQFGPVFEKHAMFPERTNTEFIRIDDRQNIRMRVWERGSDETIACGTGATASAYACIINGKCDNAVTVHLTGGDLLIEYDEQSHHLFMTGPASFVFDGEVDW